MRRLPFVLLAVALASCGPDEATTAAPEDRDLLRARLGHAGRPGPAGGGAGRQTRGRVARCRRHGRRLRRGQRRPRRRRAARGRAGRASSPPCSSATAWWRTASSRSPAPRATTFRPRSPRAASRSRWATAAERTGRRREPGRPRPHPVRGVRLLGVPRPAGGGRLPSDGGRRRAGADANRRRQEPVLPDPRTEPARPGTGGLAADRADGRPGGGVAPGGRRGGGPALRARRGQRRAAVGQARGRAAPRSSTSRPSGCCRAISSSAWRGGRSRSSRSTRRIACPPGATSSAPNTASSAASPNACPACRGWR